MKVFKFRLESVLLLREREEQAAQQEYARALQAMALAQQALSDAERLRDELGNVFAERRRHGFHASDQDLFWNAMQQRSNECRQYAAALEKTVAETERTRVAMFAARKRHEMLVQLKRNRLDEHEAAERRNEELMIDDMVSSRYAARLGRIA